MTTDELPAPGIVDIFDAAARIAPHAHATPVLTSRALDAEAGARLLALHRADSIVRDFEALREAHFPGRQWWTLGQSYGGFLTLQYLSHFPESVVASAITGGSGSTAW